VSAVLGAIATAFSWTFPATNSAVTLVLGGLIGWCIRELLSLPGRSARERKQAEAVKAASKEGAREGAKEAMKEYADWQGKHPGEPVTEPVREQIAATAAEAAVVGVGHIGAMRTGASALWRLKPPFTPGGETPR